MATLKELATLTGFSQATISRVLNNDPTMSVSDTTRAAIFEAAGELHYKTSNRTRKPRGAHKNPLRFAVAEMLTPAEQLGDPYFLFLKNFAEQQCIDRGAEVCHLRAEGNGYRLDTPLQVDGVLAIGIFSEEQVERLSYFSRNLVFLDSAPDETRFDSVVLNFRIGVELALDHLRALGHSEIGFIGPDRKLDYKKRPAPEVRRQHFIKYMEEHHLFHPEFVFETPMDAGIARATLLHEIQAGHTLPTALLAANEETAIGAVGALRAAGLHVPQDISVISFNDTARSELTDPPLTSVSTHAEDMSAAAIEMLARRAEYMRRSPNRPAMLPFKIVVPPTLIERQSVAAPCR